MRHTRILLTFMALFFMTGAMGQEYYDITGFYIKNAGFDSDFDYTVDDTGHVAQEILEVKDWIKDFTVNYTITGVYQIA